LVEPISRLGPRWRVRRFIAFIVLDDDLAFCAWQRALYHVRDWLRVPSLDYNV
jgi:hypothetical protein